MDDEEVYVEPVSLPLTRPPMKWGVRYEVFALNGILAVVGGTDVFALFLSIGYDAFFPRAFALAKHP